jgi:hypothetical protein
MLAPAPAPRLVFDVRTYGAIGNGTADDTTAIQAAITAAGAVGGVVYLPPGSFVLSSNLSLASGNVTLRGAGMTDSILLAPISTENAIVVSAADCALEDLAINGRYASQAAIGSVSFRCGVRITSSNARRFQVRRCYIYNTRGMGISNAFAADMAVENCRLENLATYAGKVQATPAPTTTTFALPPGSSVNLTAGDSIRIASQTATIQSIQTVLSYVAAVTSTSVFTVNVGTGASFSNGQVIRVGPNSGTIQSISGDIITLTGALAALPVIGQIVAIDNVTLTTPITAPTAGQLVTPTAALACLVAIWCEQAGAIRPRIVNNSISGWSQAIGIWFGSSQALIMGNNLVRNYGYADDALTTIRSALEVYPSTAVGGFNRIIGNLVDGSTHCCMEIAQGELGTLIQGNTLLNWSAELGLLASDSAMDLQGDNARPGVGEGHVILGNYFRSNGAFLSNGVNIAGFTYKISVTSNSFMGFSGATGCYPVIIQPGASTEAPLISGNTFGFCYRAVLVNSTGLANGQIIGNRADGSPGGGVTYDFQLSGDGWIVANNVSVTSTTGNTTGIQVGGSGGGSHRIIGNRLSCRTPMIVYTNDNLIMGNFVTKTVSDGAAPLRLLNALRNQVVYNCAHNSLVASLSIGVEGTSNFNIVQNNQLTGGASAAISNTSSGANNTIEPNGTSAIQIAPTAKILAGQTVGTVQVTIAHTLGYTPTRIDILMTSAGTIWRSAVSDATNIYLTADSAGRTCDVYVR